MNFSAGRTLLTIFTVALLSATTALATPISPGFDLFAAVPGDGAGNGSQWDFTATPIPADFFVPGSDPFVDLVLLEGQPIGFGDLDTIIERFDGVNPFDPGDGPQPIAIELVALSLKSIAPITVGINGGVSTEDWDVHVDLSNVQPSGGIMNVDHSQPNGGNFDATLFLQPLFIFTMVSDPSEVRVLDTVLEGMGPFNLPTLGSGPWVHTMPPQDLHFATGVSAGDFYPDLGSPLIFDDPGSNSQLVYNTAIPEPTTLGLMLVGSLLLLRRRA